MKPASSHFRKQAIGERIQRARKRRGMTQRELAEVIGVTPAAVSQIERGATVPEERLPQIAVVLEISAEDLMESVPIIDLTREEVAVVRALRGLPPEGRRYVNQLILDGGRAAR